jgi:acetoacetyl-CoA synthetase
MPTTTEGVTDSQVARFARSAGLATTAYESVYEFSVTELEGFWGAVWDFFGLGERTDRVLIDSRWPGAQWFPDQSVNYVTRVLEHRGRIGEAIVGIAEDGSREVVMWDELPALVAATAELLREHGVSAGDRVAGYLPDEPFAVIAFLATASIGAVWSACGADYAAEGAAGRLAQLSPKVLFARHEYRYRGKVVDKRADNAALAQLLGLDDDDVITRLPTPSSSQLEPVLVPFDHPLWVLFSSGTTGTPKGIVHGHGGVLLEHLKVLGLHNEVTTNDVFFWHTALSWMMWNYRTAGLLLGATVVCYSGDPLFPTADRLWQICEDETVTFFGTSPGQLLASSKAGLTPGKQHELNLRLLGSTGSPLAPELFGWVDKNIEHGLSISSVSGGTDVCSAFCGGTGSVRHVPGELTVRYLGCALESWSPVGEPIVGEMGEMVITKPMPSMPVAFWNDPTGARYRAAYFDHEWPQARGETSTVWRHGDWMTLTSRGSVVIYGRSDATLNRNGIRIGSAEIYEVVESMDEIAEAMVVGVDDQDGGYWMPMFVTLRPGIVMTGELEVRIVGEIRRRLSARHVPDEILQPSAIPRTKTGKKMEVPITGILAGRRVEVDLKSIENPDALSWYRELAEWRATAKESVETAG